MVPEHSANKTERWFKQPYAVAVGYEETFSCNITDNRAVYHFDAYFVAQIVEKPNIVVARKPCYSHSGIGQCSQCPEKPYIAAWHDRAVFIPVVEHISDEVNSFGRIADRVQEADNFCLMEASVRQVAGSQMQVADEICGMAAHAVTGIRVRVWLPRSSCPCSIRVRTQG